MKCNKCGYDWSNSGDSAHVCGPVKVMQQRPSRSDMTWVGLTDEDLAVCGDEDDVMLARYWERVCKEKNT